MTQPPQYRQPDPGGPYRPPPGQPYPQQPQPTHQQHPQSPQAAYSQPAHQPYRQPPQQPHPQPQQPYAQPPRQPYHSPRPQPYPRQTPPQGHPQPVHQSPGQGGVACRVCDSVPAAQATFRGVVGAVFMHTIWTARGPFCRDCGLHTFRRQTARTLTGGWCGIGALVLAPIFLLANLGVRGRITGLPAPQPQGGQAPLDPGPPVFRRPGAYLYPTLMIALVALIVIGNLNR